MYTETKCTVGTFSAHSFTYTIDLTNVFLVFEHKVTNVDYELVHLLLDVLLLYCVYL